ncbi:MAG TPA: PASTA domain-containing protein [Nocardioidaceae bacterium]|nr:PASTA domain-containing protein [Nocardioidaceae bacterium]
MTTGNARRANSRRQRWWKSKAALGAGVLALLALSTSCVPEEQASTSADKQPDSSSAVTPEAQTQEEPEVAKVPLLRGLDLAEAKQALREAGLRIGEVQRQFSNQAPGTVLKQAVRSGAESALGAVVPIIVAKPLPKIPSVVGASGSAAASTLRAAGYRVTTSTETRTSGSSDVVLSQSPSGGAQLLPGKEVHLVISKVVVPLASSGGGGNCTPGYTPCLPPASDYDCAGGSGNGPEYTGYVKVTGSDPYDLDADGDGIACEG